MYVCMYVCIYAMYAMYAIYACMCMYVYVLQDL